MKRDSDLSAVGAMNEDYVMRMVLSNFWIRLMLFALTVAFIGAMSAKARDEGSGIASYQWYLGGELVGTGVRPTISFKPGLKPGVYTFTLIVRDSEGAMDSDDVVVTVVKKKPRR